MKKTLILMICTFFLCSCSNNLTKSTNEKIKITTTIFPQYDFSRQIAKELADVSMLLPVGGESHTFEPTPKDIIEIENSDIFIYTGGESDKWIEDILRGISNPDLKILCLTDICDTLNEEHNHSVHTIDEHVWTSPLNAIKISEEIANVLSEIDSKNSSIYISNFESYKENLLNLDKDFREIKNNAKRNILVFGDRFPFKYLTNEYGFEYLSAFPGCAEDTEPDIKTIKSLIDTVIKKDIPIVFYTDFSNHKIADTISEETGAKLLTMRSCHTVTKEELKNNITYIDLMMQNIKNLKEALN